VSPNADYLEGDARFGTTLPSLGTNRDVFLADELLELEFPSLQTPL
jgi:hypothetical protein